MKLYPSRSVLRRVHAIQIPPFHAVPTRQRADGWTPLKQAEFIGILAETRSVSAAVRQLSMGRESAHRLRRRPGAEGFTAAWDIALAKPNSETGQRKLLVAQETARYAARSHAKVTLPELRWRIDTGIWHVIMRAGRYCGVRQKADNSALLTLLKRVPGPYRDFAGRHGF